MTGAKDSIIELWDGRKYRPAQTLYLRYILREHRTGSFPNVMLDWKMRRKVPIYWSVRIHRYFSQVYDQPTKQANQAGEPA